MTNFKEKSNLIWAVADFLRGDYKQSDYGKVILPMTVLRRLDLRVGAQQTEGVGAQS
jgi:type I restriction enzyme M protein